MRLNGMYISHIDCELHFHLGIAVNCDLMASYYIIKLQLHPPTEHAPITGYYTEHSIYHTDTLELELELIHSLSLSLFTTMYAYSNSRSVERTLLKVKINNNLFRS